MANTEPRSKEYVSGKPILLSEESGGDGGNFEDV